MRLPHILRAHEPQDDGVVIEVLCGKIITDARFALTITGDIAGKLKVSREDFCGKCIDAAEEKPDPESRYVYGVVLGAWLKRETESE